VDSWLGEEVVDVPLSSIMSVELRSNAGDVTLEDGDVGGGYCMPPLICNSAACKNDHHPRVHVLSNLCAGV